MCKVFAMTNVSKVNVSPEFLSLVRDAVCATSDKDGYGYAVNTASGAIWGERALNPMTFQPLQPYVDSTTARCPIADVQSNQFGPVGAKDNLAFIAHGRLSTNVTSIANTHPFLNQDSSVALIHNGIVSDPDSVVSHELLTSCDTEILLRLWDRGGIDAIEEHAAGYYAIALLDNKGSLHIARDDRASLYIAYSSTVDSYLIATTEDILHTIAAGMSWQLDAPLPVKENTYAVFQGNEVVLQQEIAPIGYVSLIDTSKLDAALGADRYISYDDLTYDDAPYDDDEPAYRRA
jgi:predicted glutamine amidotransferase